MPSQVRAALAGSPVKDLRALAREADKVLNSSRLPGPAVRVVGAADVQAIREDVIAATQRQRPTAGLCYYHARFNMLFVTDSVSDRDFYATQARRLASSLVCFGPPPGAVPGPHHATFSSAAVKHGVDHFITTTGPPVTLGQGGWTQKLAMAKAEFDSMEHLGIVHDILVASVTSDEHQAHLRALLHASANTG
ncbi:hypothetical protein AAFF_G00398350 [Aldrovandia affinis]|uniref:Uncharacterized protein n=1 Tax=Aldrovandia affinis TaxID=143900 RepID=A0AAD7SCI5_9TELE|nr:hypothetical protein AAFF_G00398350 [Aldrovandia affinis]